MTFPLFCGIGKNKGGPASGGPEARRGATAAHKNPPFKEDKMETAVNLLSNYIFPVAMCVILLWKMEKDQERYRDDLNSMRDVIAKNTEVMTQLKTMLEKEL